MSDDITKPLLARNAVSDSGFAATLHQPSHVRGYGTLLNTHASEAGGTTSPPRDLHPIAESHIDQERESTVFDDEIPMKRDAFCKLIGIKQHADYGASPAELEAGAGLYHDIRVSYDATYRMHLWFEIGIYTALLSQVLLSANFIILGAMRGDHHIPIAVLGAISVSIAGCLALVKGQGLPMRLRIERDSLWEVQLGAEELHWQMASGKPVMFGDVKRIWQRYVQVKKDASLNHPDTWTSSATTAAQPVDVNAKLMTGTTPTEGGGGAATAGPAISVNNGASDPSAVQRGGGRDETSET